MCFATYQKYDVQLWHLRLFLRRNVAPDERIGQWPHPLPIAAGELSGSPSDLDLRVVGRLCLPRPTFCME
jgi:hypothetical protein